MHPLLVAAGNAENHPTAALIIGAAFVAIVLGVVFWLISKL